MRASDRRFIAELRTQDLDLLRREWARIEGFRQRFDQGQRDRDWILLRKEQRLRKCIIDERLAKQLGL